MSAGIKGYQFNHLRNGELQLVLHLELESPTKGVNPVLWKPRPLMYKISKKPMWWWKEFKYIRVMINNAIKNGKRKLQIHSSEVTVYIGEDITINFYQDFKPLKIHTTCRIPIKWWIAHEEELNTWIQENALKIYSKHKLPLGV